MQIRGVLFRTSRALERLYRERDLFRPYELLLALPGFHLAEKFRAVPWKRALFLLSRAILLLQYVIWGNRFYLALADPSTRFGKALHYGNTFGVLTMMLARMLVVRWHLPSVRGLMEYLRRQRARTGSPVPKTHRTSYWKVVNIAITFQLIGLADRAVFCFSRTYRQELYEIPDNLAQLGWPMVAALHILSFDFATRWAAAYNVSLTGMNSIMMGLYDELEGIAQEYSELLAKGRDGEGIWTRFERNTARAVKRHETFLLQLDQLKPFLETTFLVMFYSAVLFLAMGTFIISASGTSTYGVILSGFLFALLLECYWCCQLVDRLNDVNAQIGMQLYSLEWPMELQYTESTGGRYRQARASLLIMMSKTQKTLGIRCGGMFEMSGEAFASLVKMTYTMLMFLRDTQKLT
uniref:Uncharacterized protein n=1 Tax=Anopheles epiroticus TaxID=199890 RepID=A0A182PDM7_9DIPT